MKKKIQLETHIKQLSELKKKSLDPYLEHLETLYSEYEEYEGIVDVFIAYIRCDKELTDWQTFKEELTTDDPKKVYSLRNSFWQPLKKILLLRPEHFITNYIFISKIATYFL